VQVANIKTERSKIFHKDLMIIIRKAVPDDSEKIISFQVAMARETEEIALDSVTLSCGVNTVFVSPGKGQYYVAEDKGEVVASLLITYEWSDWRNSDVWWFQSVYVIPSYRRRGIFRMMYSHIKNEAMRQNIAGLRLYVESNNDPAKKTYEAMGMSSQHYTMYEWLR
jgi:ribosomal protein S18 acetylase RimI-like enzyme